MKAIIVGASGLIGNELLQILLTAGEYHEVLILVRKELPLMHPKLKQVVVDFNKLNDYSALINGHAIFCCLGSTNQKTPDKELYRKVDHDYPLQLAEMAKANGVAQYHLVSAASANASSSIFYSKLKGETEEDLIKVGLQSLHIYRPMLLTGNRTEYRKGERFAIALFKVIDPLLIGGLKKYRSIAGKTVATTMYKQSLKNETGVIIYPSIKIQDLS